MTYLYKLMEVIHQPSCNKWHNNDSIGFPPVVSCEYITTSEVLGPSSHPLFPCSLFFLYIGYRVNYIMINKFNFVFDPYILNLSLHSMWTPHRLYTRTLVHKYYSIASIWNGSTVLFRLSVHVMCHKPK